VLTGGGVPQKRRAAALRACDKDSPRSTVYFGAPTHPGEGTGKHIADEWNDAPPRRRNWPRSGAGRRRLQGAPPTGVFARLGRTRGEGKKWVMWPGPGWSDRRAQDLDFTRKAGRELKRLAQGRSPRPRKADTTLLISRQFVPPPHAASCLATDGPGQRE